MSEDLDELKRRLFQSMPNQWPVLLNIAEAWIARTGEFASLREFIEAPVVAGGMGMQVADVVSILGGIRFLYRSQIAERMAMLGCAPDPAPPSTATAEGTRRAIARLTQKEQAEIVEMLAKSLGFHLISPKPSKAKP